MSRLPQVPETNATEVSGVKPCGIPSVACPQDGGGAARMSRREASYKIGTWSIYLGVLGGAAALGGACTGSGSSDSTGTPTPGGTTPTGSGTPTPTGSVTPTSSPTPAPTFAPNASCECENDSNFMTDGTYVATTLNIQDIPPGAVALNTGVSLPGGPGGTPNSYGYPIICNDTGLNITPGRLHRDSSPRASFARHIRPSTPRTGLQTERRRAEAEASGRICRTSPWPRTAPDKSG
jgi:hypothetical protein